MYSYTNQHIFFNGIYSSSVFQICEKKKHGKWVYGEAFNITNNKNIGNMDPIFGFALKLCLIFEATISTKNGILITGMSKTRISNTRTGRKPQITKTLHEEREKRHSRYVA